MKRMEGLKFYSVNDLQQLHLRSLIHPDGLDSLDLLAQCLGLMLLHSDFISHLSQDDVEVSRNDAGP